MRSEFLLNLELLKGVLFYIQMHFACFPGSDNNILLSGEKFLPQLNFPGTRFRKFPLKFFPEHISSTEILRFEYFCFREVCHRIVIQHETKPRC